MDSDATEENIQETLNSTSKPDIVNVIYLSGHGDDGRIIIEKPLKYKNLISMCRNTEAPEIIIVGACYSGSIRKQLSEDDNIIVISSTDGDFSDSASEQVGITASLYDVFKHPQKADLNGDLQVTMEEVWLRAKEVHEEFLNSNTWKEQSQYWNSVPENKYGLFGNKDFILFEI